MKGNVRIEQTLSEGGASTKAAIQTIAHYTPADQSHAMEFTLNATTKVLDV